jgi:methionyl-tRNA formyltransferase
MQFHVAYFGLPLGALLLLEDGHLIDPCVVSMASAPGLHRLRRHFGSNLLEARRLEERLDGEVERRLDAAAPDLIVSWFWTRKLPARWLKQPRLGAIGVHPSLLPRHRGPNPYFWAIDAGDRETGVSVHQLEPDYDTGAVIAQERLSIGDRNAWQLARALDRLSLRQLRTTLQSLAKGGALMGVPQDGRAATQAPEPEGALLRVDFAWPTERVLRRIRALSPVPGVALELAGIEFFVTTAQRFQGFTRALEPGEAQITDQHIVLRTGDGAIWVERAALIGKHGETEDLTGAELSDRIAKRLESRSRAL